MSATSRTSTTGPGDAPTTDPGVVREQIEDTRRALGDTVDALDDKVDVKARVSAKITQGKDRLRLERARLAHRARQNQAPLAGTVATVLAVLGTLLFWRRHRQTH
jgi:hypothetical protein